MLEASVPPYTDGHCSDSQCSLADSVPHSLVFIVPLMLAVNMLLYTGGQVAPLTLVVTVPLYTGSRCASLPLFSVRLSLRFVSKALYPDAQWPPLYW